MTSVHESSESSKGHDEKGDSLTDDWSLQLSFLRMDASYTQLIPTIL